MPSDDRTSPLESFDLRSYVDVLARRWRVIAVVALTAVLVALGLSLRQDKQYLAEADILIGQQRVESALGDSLSTYIQALNAARALNNEVEALESGVTRDAVAAVYEGSIDPDDVDVEVTSASSDVARVSVRASNPEDAADLVNTYVEVATSLRRQQRTDDLLQAVEEVQAQVADIDSRIASIREPLTQVEIQLASDPGDAALEARRNDLTRTLEPSLSPLESQKAVYQGQIENLQLLAGIAQSGGSTLLTAAEVPADPVSPKPVQNAVLALVVGLLLGVVLAFVRDNLDERIRGLDDLQRAAPGLPPLAVVPETRDLGTSFVAMRDDSSSLAAEAFRSLRTSVKFASLDNPIQVIQVTSALQGEGKTTTVANLAEALAQGGETVAVVCFDLRRPRIHTSFGQSLTPGFTDVVLQEAPLSAAVRRVDERLFLLPAGSPPPNPSELLSTNRAAAVIESLAAEFDVVLIDSTPVLPVTDALVVSRLVDCTLVVVDTRTTKRKVLRQALDRLEQVSAPVAGLVLNGASSGSYGYGYGYAYAYGDTETVPDGDRNPTVGAAR